MSDLHPVILSGGFGTRLWPASRDSMPKQLLKLLGERSSFQETLLRLHGVVGVAPPTVITNESHRFLLADQALEAGVKLAALITEPVARDTAAAVAMAALWLERQNPDAVMLVMPADHHISPASRYAAEIAAALPAAKAGHIVIFGIKPRWPSPAFGYIRRAAEERPGAYAVKAFVEKPSPEEAARYIETGEYFWNCGLVLSRAATLLAEFREHRPDILTKAEEAVNEARKDEDFVRLARAPLESCPAISLDYAILEKTSRVCVRELRGVTWSDVGTWAEIHALSPRDEHANTVRDNAIFVDAKNCFAHVEDGRVAALVGVSDLVVVSTPDVVFVGPLDSAGALKTVVQKLRATRPELVSGLASERKGASGNGALKSRS
ncbi:MAG: mannose-1-phosphate guanylyltransferase [Hyphomicrobiales bacterium]